MARLRRPGGFVGRGRRRVDALLGDPAVDRRVDPRVGRIGAVQARREIVREREGGAVDAREPAVEPHPVPRELPQIDVAPAIAAGHVVVGLLARRGPLRVLLDRQVVMPHVVQPGDDVPATVEARHARRITDREVHLTPRQVQILGDLRTRLAGADDEHRAIRQHGGVAVLLRMHLRHPRRQRTSERRHSGTW